jgi:hypothetical protein
MSLRMAEGTILGWNLRYSLSGSFSAPPLWLTITRGEADQAVSPDAVAQLVQERLGKPEFGRFRSAIAALIESMPRPSRKRRKSAR